MTRGLRLDGTSGFGEAQATAQKRDRRETHGSSPEDERIVDPSPALETIERRFWVPATERELLGTGQVFN